MFVWLTPQQYRPRRLVLKVVRFTASEIADAVGGVVHGDPATVVTGATQDSREITAGQLFVPLLAERDGHDFIAKALERGAAAYLTSAPPIEGTSIGVDDTTRALEALGAYSRSRLTDPVIGITGSVGKTSAKDLLAAILAADRPTHASAKSFNNEIGVPLTLVNAPDATEATVVEMGARGVGHIEMLSRIVEPTIGVVTTVAGAHTGEFGSIENIAIAKGELVEALPNDGLAVLNADNPLVAAMENRTAAEVITFGESPNADVQITSVELDAELRPTIRIESKWGNITAQPPIRGAHLAPNVAASIAVALWLGLTPAVIGEGLAKAQMSPWRMEVFAASSGALVINDSYNANPTSTRGAIDSLSRLEHGRKVAILGYMAELGDQEASLHREIATEVETLGIELVAVGTDLYGVEPVTSPLDALGSIGADTAVLIKASRSAGLEQVADQLR